MDDTAISREEMRAEVLAKFERSWSNTAATRKQAERQRKRSAGLAPMEVWAPPALHQKIREFVAAHCPAPRPSERNTDGTSDT